MVSYRLIDPPCGCKAPGKSRSKDKVTKPKLIALLKKICQAYFVVSGSPGWLPTVSISPSQCQSASAAMVSVTVVAVRVGIWPIPAIIGSVVRKLSEIPEAPVAFLVVMVAGAVSVVSVIRPRFVICPGGIVLGPAGSAVP